jgi:hypothetical protein
MYKRSKLAAAFVGVLALIAASLAYASPNSGSGTSTASTSSITLNAPAVYGGTASFTAVDPPVKGTPEMSVTCWQNSQPVYLDVQVMSGASPFHPQFTLWSTAWAANNGGSANCTANLFYYTWKGKVETGVVYMATTSFVAQGV